MERTRGRIAGGGFQDWLIAKSVVVAARANGSPVIRGSQHDGQYDADATKTPVDVHGDALIYKPAVVASRPRWSGLVLVRSRASRGEGSGPRAVAARHRRQFRLARRAPVGKAGYLADPGRVSGVKYRLHRTYEDAGVPYVCRASNRHGTTMAQGRSCAVRDDHRGTGRTPRPTRPIP